MKVLAPLSAKHPVAAGVVAALLVTLSVLWLFSAPLQASAMLLIQSMATPLVALEEGWIAWAVSPVNNIASVVVLSVKAVRMLWKRISNASYVN